MKEDTNRQDGAHLPHNPRPKHPPPPSAKVSMAFRVAAAILAGAAVLLFFLVHGLASLGRSSTWQMIAAAAGPAFMLAKRSMRC